MQNGYILVQILRHAKIQNINQAIKRIKDLKKGVPHVHSFFSWPSTKTKGDWVRTVGGLNDATLILFTTT